MQIHSELHRKGSKPQLTFIDPECEITVCLSDVASAAREGPPPTSGALAPTGSAASTAAATSAALSARPAQQRLAATSRTQMAMPSPSPMMNGVNEFLNTGKPFHLAFMQNRGQVLRLAHNPNYPDDRDADSFFVYADTAHVMNLVAQREPSDDVRRCIFLIRKAHESIVGRDWPASEYKRIRDLKHVPPGWYVPHSHTHAHVCRLPVVIAAAYVCSYSWPSSGALGPYTWAICIDAMPDLDLCIYIITTARGSIRVQY